MRKWIVIIIGLILSTLVAGANLHCNSGEESGCNFLCFS
jgi:hypothetical protein